MQGDRIKEGEVKGCGSFPLDTRVSPRPSYSPRPSVLDPRVSPFDTRHSTLVSFRSAGPLMRFG